MKNSQSMGCGVVIVPGFLVFLIYLGIEILRASYRKGDPIELWIVLLILLPLVVILGYLSTKIFKADQRGLGFTVAAVTALFISLGICIVIVATSGVNRPPDEVVQSVTRACEGQAIPAAGDYDAGKSGPYHIVLLDESGAAHQWTGLPPKEWRPETITDTELVACVQRVPEETLIETCDYSNGFDIKRFRKNLVVRVVAAHTGAEVASIVLEADPRECLKGEKREITELHGDIPFAMLEERLRYYVSGTASSN